MTSTDTNAHPAAHTHAYILLDRTGSMSNIWTEALGSVNAYVDALTKPADGAKPSGDDKVTLAQGLQDLQSASHQVDISGP
jgi:hypothetical protein